MPKITRAFKRELITLMIHAFKTGKVTLNKCPVTKWSLWRHIENGYIKGCNYNSSDYDFRTDTGGIQNNSDYQFNVERFAQIERD